MPVSLLLKLLPYAAAIALALVGIYYVHHDGFKEGQKDVQAQWDAAKAVATKAALDATAANLKHITELEKTKNDNLATIDALHENNTQFRLDKHTLWMRLQKATCAGGLSDTTTSSGGTNTTTSSGVVSTKPQSSPEQAFGEFVGGAGDEAYRADKIVEDCRVVLDWAKAQER